MVNRSFAHMKIIFFKDFSSGFLVYFVIDPNTVKISDKLFSACYNRIK